MFPATETALTTGAAMAASFAPPCNGPRKVPMAEVTEEKMSESVEAQTLAAKVEALNSCSA